MKFPETAREMLDSWYTWSSDVGVRFFTFVPRRFTTHYWDARHYLFTITWWQLFRRCFCVRSRIINRPEYSSWIQICQRANYGDRDAMLIRDLVKDIQVRIVS